MAYYTDSGRLATLVGSDANSPWLIEAVGINPSKAGSASLTSNAASLISLTPTGNTYMLPYAGVVAGQTYATFSFSTEPQSGVVLPSNLFLNSSTGQLTFDVTPGTTFGLYAVQVRVNQTSSVTNIPLSTIVVDFIISLVQSTQPPPVFVSPPTPAAGSVITTQVGCNPLTINILVTASTSATLLAVGLPVSSASVDFSATSTSSGASGVIHLHPQSGFPMTNIQLQATDQQSPPLTTYLSLTLALNTTACPTTSVLGDPQFYGFLGQSFQVHGIDGEVYALISDVAMALNARFVFLDQGVGVCPSGLGLACWSHPGSYLGEMAIMTNTSAILYVQPGSGDQGYSSVALNSQPVAVGSTVQDESGALRVSRYDAHRLIIHVTPFEMELDNSQGFLNIRSIHHQGSVRSHGLLGQTWNARPHSPGAIKWITGEVDDYVIEGSDLFGTHFIYSQFSRKE